MTRAGWLKLVGALALLMLAGWWFVTQTEWVEVDEPLPLRGEAARKPHYAAMQVLRKLGAQVVERPNLDQMPPADATMLLTSNHWSLFPGRAERLTKWVEQGGHLVIARWLLDEDELKTALPVFARSKPQPKKGEKAHFDDLEEDPQDAPPAVSGFAMPRPGPRCKRLREIGSPVAFGSSSLSLRLCGSYNHEVLQPLPGTPVLWSLDGPHGPETLRVPMGRGTLTVFTGGTGWLENRPLLRGDNALALLATLGTPARGSVVWLVVDETRTPLLPWLWQQAWIVWAAGALALLFALWRAGTRFGPRAALPPLGRRSVIEQIRGTAEFIWQREPRALHAAQLKALESAALARLRGYARMERSARAQALAQATGLPADAIGRALDGRIERPHAAWPPVLALLEDTRRRLLAASAPIKNTSSRGEP